MSRKRGRNVPDESSNGPITLGETGRSAVGRGGEILRIGGVVRPAAGTLGRMETPTHAESLEDAQARWRDWQATTCTQSTIHQRGEAVLRLTEHAAAGTGRAPEDVDPRDLTAEDIAAWIGQRHLTANSRATYSRHVSSWFAWLHVTGRIPANPMAGIRRPRASRGVPKPLSAGELARVMLGADPRLRAIMTLAVHAGLRSHEIAKFRGEDLDRERRAIVVLGKGGVEARIPAAAAVLELAESMPREGWWFPSPTRGRQHIGSTYVGRLVAERFREVGITKGSVHRGRHTFGTMVQRTGRDLEVTRRLMRHSSISTTIVYTDVEDDRLTAALGGLDTLTALTA